MGGAGELLVHVAGVLVLASLALTTWWAWRARRVWGSVSRPVAAGGAGPYRRGLVHEVVARRPPLGVVLVAGVGVAWALLTWCVFAPGGLIFLLSPARHDPARQMMLTFAGLGAFGSSIAGFALAGSLMRASLALLTRAANTEEETLTVAAWSATHHVLVLFAFSLFAVHEHDPRFALEVAVPCAIGVAHAWCLARAARYVAQLRDHDEWL